MEKPINRLEILGNLIFLVGSWIMDPIGLDLVNKMSWQPQIKWPLPPLSLIDGPITDTDFPTSPSRKGQGNTPHDGASTTTHWKIYLNTYPFISTLFSLYLYIYNIYEYNISSDEVNMTYRRVQRRTKSGARESSSANTK